MNFILILYVLVIILSIYVGNKTEVSWGKVIMLTLFPPLMVAFFIGIKSGGAFLLIALYGLMMMLPALLVYAVMVLYVVEKYKLGYISQFFTGAVIGYIAGFVLFVIANQQIKTAQFIFALLPMITGAVSIVLIEYLNTKDEKDAK